VKLKQRLKTLFGVGPTPGIYKTKYAKNTLIEVFDDTRTVSDKYDSSFQVRFSLKEGGNITEDKNGVGMMGLMPDEPYKARFYPVKHLYQYFDRVK